MKEITRAYFDLTAYLYKLLHDLTGYDMSLPMNSGAEAVEAYVREHGGEFSAGVRSAV